MGKWFFKIWPKSKWRKIKIGYLAAILKRYNILNFFCRIVIFDKKRPVHIWCKFQCKIPVGKKVFGGGVPWNPLGHQRELKYLGHLCVIDKELPMTQGGYQVIIILPIKSKMAAAKKQCFLRFLYFTESLPPSFKIRGLQMTMNLALV